MLRARNYSKRSKGRKDRIIGTRQDPDLYVVPIYDERSNDIVFGRHTATNSNRNGALRMYLLAVHSFETLGTRRRIDIQFLFILSDDMAQAVNRE